jgi:hypothetical protein
VDSGSTGVPDLADVVEGHETAAVRMALARAADEWQIMHAEVTLDSVQPTQTRTWRYADELLLERPLRGAAVASLLRAEAQDLDGLTVSAPAPPPDCTFQRLAGHSRWRQVVLPWPRTEWEISRVESTAHRHGGVRVGDGPPFVSFEAAFSSFFYGALPTNLASQQPLWRIVLVDRRAWLHRVAVGPDAMVVTVKGTSLGDVVLELSTPTSRLTRPVGRTGKVRVRLPHGLADSSLLLLRQGDDWLDYRYFLSPTPTTEHGPSVVWDQPGADVAVLVAGGEGPRVEFKQEVPTTPGPKKNVLKTVAAFASGGGGTVLFGVDDHAQVVGIGTAALDQYQAAVSQMIRNSIEPEPPHSLRAVQADGKTLLLVEVAAGGRLYALHPAKPEFYVRRGASTVPARLGEIAAGFGSSAAALAWTL